MNRDAHCRLVLLRAHYRVGDTTDRLVTAMRRRDDSIDSLLAEFDRSLSLSRRVFHPEVDEGVRLSARTCVC